MPASVAQLDACPTGDQEVVGSNPTESAISLVEICLFDLGLTSLSTFFSHIAMVSGCGRELNAHF